MFSITKILNDQLMTGRISQKQCSVDGCNNNAAYSAHLSLAVHANHDPIITTAIVYLCEQHKDKPTWEELCVDHNWDAICNSIISIGRQAPKKEFSKIIIHPLP